MDHNSTLIENVTVIDDNPFLDGDESVHYYDGVYQTIKVFTIIGELLKLVTGTLCLGADIYLIVIMSRFKNLRTRLNNRILLYAIFNLCYMLLTNILLIIATEVFGGWYVETYCILKNLDHLIMTLSFYVLTLMVVEWYVYNYQDGFYKRHTNLFKYGIVIVISLAIPEWFISTLSCFAYVWYSYVRFTLEGLSFVISLAVVLTITVLKNKKTPLSDAYKTEYVLPIARTVLLCFLPAYILWIFYEILTYNSIKYSSVSMRLVYLTEYISDVCSYMASTLVLFKLPKLNKYFKVAYLKCCKKNVDEYTDEDLDNDSLHNVQVKNVTYDKETEVVNI